MIKLKQAEWLVEHNCPGPFAPPWNVVVHQLGLGLRICLLARQVILMWCQSLCIFILLVVSLTQIWHLDDWVTSEDKLSLILWYNDLCWNLWIYNKNRGQASTSDTYNMQASGISFTLCPSTILNDYFVKVLRCILVKPFPILIACSANTVSIQLLQQEGDQ